MTQPYYQHNGITLYQADCLDVMPELEAHSFDAIITDIPYGTTACSWDTVIPFDPMWTNIKRLIKPRGAVVLFGSEPFSSALRMSNLAWFKYDWVWDKGRGFNPQLANVQPMKAHENICVFAEEGHNYYPQKTPLTNVLIDKRGRSSERANRKNGGGHQLFNSPRQDKTYVDRFPESIIYFSAMAQTVRVHETQKPLALMQYLVRTYTKPGDTILDFTSGSGTTLEAAKSEGRYAVGIERDRDDKGNILGYCDYTVDRLSQESLFNVPEVATQPIATLVDSSQRSLFDILA